ncbi:2-oxoacid:acceptor oxidoreductase subunit alpha [Congregibacter variabilis]|uniref:2-oxoacid:acceptor oxidoreductase subunit alpha n=1 Tax=Congregibacter variabilis TaxID=3081200 RepID=A0ABZ0HY30_9GAMM|nr:2-oxoacid:acceptor oxidoreductase subunit alpha [Congregibacter sp. IMCC43200]
MDKAMLLDEFSLAITGSGGAGVMSVGELLLQAWAEEGGRGLLRKAFGPQIRGGEAAALITLTSHQRYTAASTHNLLLAFDWDNFNRFGDEIRLQPDSIVLCETPANMPDSVLALKPKIVALPFQELAKSAHPEGRVNMVALGVLGALLGIPVATLRALAIHKLADKVEDYREAALACIDVGVHGAPDLALSLPAVNAKKGWYVSGNQAAAYGALVGGVRFVAAYPITPASDVLEYLAAPLERLGGTLVQAEDELAAINMALGAAYGGVPAFTATSGPGLALMSESIGLAVASETPVTILDVMRGGPSTGIPTKSEQSDLNIALFGLHGDAPHLVLAPLSISDCVFTCAWSVQLAQRLQTAAIVLSDQFLGQSTAIIDPPPGPKAAVAEASATQTNNYLRYAIADDGLSSQSIPGDYDKRFTADGLEHNERGTPSAGARDHQQQLDKRARKLAALEPGDNWGETYGTGPVALMCFGSAAAALVTAYDKLLSAGMDCRVIALRLLAPLPVEQLMNALDGCSRIIVIEQNHSAQLLHYLRGYLEFSGKFYGVATPGPVPLSPAAIVTAVSEALNDE